MKIDSELGKNYISNTINLINSWPDKKCHCESILKDNYRKTKKQIIYNFAGINTIKIDPKTNQIIGKDNKMIINSTDFYDIVIDIKSIKDINIGWNIKMSKRAEENYKSFLKDKVLKIGVIGNSNKGKSFLNYIQIFHNYLIKPLKTLILLSF